MTQRNHYLFPSSGVVKSQSTDRFDGGLWNALLVNYTIVEDVIKNMNNVNRLDAFFDFFLIHSTFYMVIFTALTKPMLTSWIMDDG